MKKTTAEATKLKLKARNIKQKINRIGKHLGTKGTELVRV